MRAFVITAPGVGGVQEVDEPVAGPGQVVIDVARIGVCGTDAELFSGAMAYLATGEATYPIRIGHEWCGTVSAVGNGVDPTWIGRRVTGDTMLGCGHCKRCTTGRQHLCAQRFEIGIRDGWPGALAERLPMPVSALVPLPDSVDDTLGALVEPGGNALRTVEASNVTAGSTMLVLGAGTIGLLVAQIAQARGVEVHILGRSSRSREFAASLGFDRIWTEPTLDRSVQFDAVVDASNDESMPALAAQLVEPGGRVVYIGLSGDPSLVDTRTLALNDVTAVGVLSASGGLQGTVELYASGAVDPRPLIAATVGIEHAADVLAGKRPLDASAGPKIHITPTL